MEQADSFVSAGSSRVESRNGLRKVLAARHGMSEAVACAHAACQVAIDHISMKVSLDATGFIRDVNEKFCHHSQTKRQDALGKNIMSFLGHSASRRIVANILRQTRRSPTWRGDVSFISRCGERVWVDLTVVFQPGSHSRAQCFILLGLDITERKKAELDFVEERQLRLKAESLMQDIVEAIPSGIVAYDSSGTMVFANQAHKKIYADQQNRGGFALEQHCSAAAHERRAQIAGGAQPSVNLANTERRRTAVHKLPDDRWMQVQNRKSSSGLLISVHTDVTDLKRAERHIKEQASRDMLTGLYNRTALFSRLDSYSAFGGSNKADYALVLLDLDDFKSVNDGLGHAAGDALLQQVALNILRSLRKTDTIARLGGDEFAILLPGRTDERELRAILHRLNQAVSAPITVERRTIIPAASIGAACFPRDAGNPSEIIRCADHALYLCKHEGGRRFAVYDAAMHAQRARREALTEKMRLALTRGSIQVMLQPQQDIVSGSHAGFEALVRWKVGGKWIPPIEVIGIAEDAGLISELSYQVIEKSLAMHKRLKACRQEPGRLAFNTVAAQLYDPAFPARLRALIERYGAQPGEIEIEVTENVILDRSTETIAKALHILRGMGFSVALDDFGTGYASLSHLQQFSLDRLKIDRTFISGTSKSDARNLARDGFIIARTITSLAHSLDLQVVAEGIEDASQYAEMKKIGCDVAQGFYIAKPMNEETAYQYLSK